METLSSRVCVVAVIDRIILHAYSFEDGCVLSWKAEDALGPMVTPKTVYGFFALEDEEEYYAEDSEDKLYQVDGKILEDGAGRADPRRSCEMKRVADVFELVSEVVCARIYYSGEGEDDHEPIGFCCGEKIVATGKRVDFCAHGLCWRLLDVLYEQHSGLPVYKHNVCWAVYCC